MLHALLVITVTVLAAASPNPPLAGPNVAPYELYDGSSAGAVLAAASPLPQELTVAPYELVEDSADAVPAAASPSPPELTVAPYKLYEDSPLAINFADKELSDLVSGMPVGANLVDAVNQASTGKPENLSHELNCPVCWEQLNSATLATLACGHTLHNECLRAVTCPICRRKIEPDGDFSRDTDLRKFLDLLESKQWIAPPPPPGAQPGQTPAGSGAEVAEVPEDPEAAAILSEKLDRLNEVFATGIRELRAVNNPRMPRLLRSGRFNRWSNADRAAFSRDLFYVLFFLDAHSVQDLALPDANNEYDDFVNFLEEATSRLVTIFRSDSFRGLLCSTLSTMGNSALYFARIFPRRSRAMAKGYADSITRLCPVDATEA